MQRFRLGCSTREHFLKMLGGGVWWMILSIILWTQFLPRGSSSGGLWFRSLLTWALLWSSFWIISVRLPKPSLWGRFSLLLMPLTHASRLWGRRWLTWKATVSVFFPALVDPAVLEISLSFLGFVDDVVSPLFSSLIPLSSTLNVSYSIYLENLIWLP